MDFLFSHPPTLFIILYWAVYVIVLVISGIQRTGVPLHYSIWGKGNVNVNLALRGFNCDIFHYLEFNLPTTTVTLWCTILQLKMYVTKLLFLH